MNGVKQNQFILRCVSRSKGGILRIYTQSKPTEIKFDRRLHLVNVVTTKPTSRHMYLYRKCILRRVEKNWYPSFFSTMPVSVRSAMLNRRVQTKSAGDSRRKLGEPTK